MGPANETQTDPKLPTVNSTEYALLSVLATGRSIDQRDWLGMRAGWRLADAVHRARRLGWSIRTDLISIGPSVRIARYSLEESYRRKFSYAKLLAFAESSNRDVEEATL